MPGTLRRAFAALLMPLAAVALACGGGDSGPAQLVFQSNRGGSDDLYLMSVDGSGLRQLTDEPGRDYEPDSRPGDGKLVFVSDRAGEGGAQLYLMAVDGSDATRLTLGAPAGATVIDDYPHWSHDGGRVVFQRTTSGVEGTDADVWLIDVETGEERQLTDTPDAWDSAPSFSADGESVVFESNRDGDFDIYRLELESGEITQLTDEDGTDLESNVSQDGEQIAFASNRDGDFELYVMDLDGSNVRQLTDNESEERCPHWSPDGERMTFYSARDGDREVYVMNADGTDELRLTNDPGQDEVPAWVEGS